MAGDISIFGSGFITQSPDARYDESLRMMHALASGLQSIINSPVNVAGPCVTSLGPNPF